MKYLIHSEGKMAYTKSGTGSDVFLIFHGFGQSHFNMLPFEKIRKQGQCFLFIDMFYHGQSQWLDSKKNLERIHWIELIKMLQKQEEFTQFSLIGYSMGGKFSLLTFELFGKDVKKMILLAPDGIKTGLWYSMSNYPGFIQPFFKGVIFKPNRFFRIIDGLNSAGLVEKSFIKFVKTQLETRSNRAQAYFVWKVFGGIQLQLATLIQHAIINKTPIEVFIGDFDKMVKEQNLSRFKNKIPHLKQITLPVGHGQLIEATVEYLITKNKI